MYMCMQKHTDYGMMLIARINSGNNNNKKISRHYVYLPSLILNCSTMC